MFDDPDTLSAETGGPIADYDVCQARIPDVNNLNLAEFVIIGSNWEEFSRTSTNPIIDSESPAFVLQNISDDVYYRIDVDFTGTILQEVQIDSLSGCRCGIMPLIARLEPGGELAGIRKRDGRTINLSGWVLLCRNKYSINKPTNETSINVDGSSIVTA